MSIPRVLHQTWRSREIPERWQRFQRSWQDHNPDWEYRFWTDAAGRDFLSSHFPWILPVYDAFPEPIMRADALRYFLLAHFGGVYADMDYECLKPLDGILDGQQLVFGREPPEHALVPEVRACGLGWLICNALICSVPGHPFWDYVFRKLLNRSGTRGPLDATGPIMLTRAFESFPERSSVCLLDSHVLSPMTQPEAKAGRYDDPAFRSRITQRAYAVHHWDNTWARRPTRIHISDNVPVLLMRNRRIFAQSTMRMDVLREIDHGSANLPRISCLMVTRDRVSLAALAIDCFRRQSYPNRELIVVDDSTETALERHIASLEDRSIRYMRRESNAESLGELRNHAASLATGAYVAQWDDDDLSHARRLEIQMAAIRTFSTGAAFLLREFIWWPREQRLAISRSRVWESSMLCAKELLPAYPDLKQGEDTPVVARLMAEQRVALADIPALYVYVQHGTNTFGEAHFDRQWDLADTKYEGPAYTDMLQAMTACYPVNQYAALFEPAPVPARVAPAVIQPAPPAELASNKVLVLTPMKNAARHLPGYLKNLRRLTHPHENISLGFLESDSTDGTADALRDQEEALSREFRRVKLLQRDFHFHPAASRWNPAIQRERRSILARSRNELCARTLDDEDWVLWIDADVSEYPPDIIARLLFCGKQILVPDCVHEYGGPSFDLNTFQLTGDPTALHESVHIAGLVAPRGDGRRYLFELREHDIVQVDAVGGAMLLVDADLHRSGLIFPPFPYKHYLETEGLAAMARDMGVESWGLPNLQILHPRE
jgi:glycosyltransferase involved in cell wall biosynthesis